MSFQTFSSLKSVLRINAKFKRGKKKRRKDAITKNRNRKMEATRNSIPPSSLFFKRSENMRDTQGHPPHFRFMHHASSTPCFLSLPPSSHEIVREINKNPPLPPFFLSFPRTIRLPSASGFLARRIYGGKSRARFPSLAEKPTQYLLLLRRMEKFLPLLSPLIHVRGWFSRAGFASSLPLSKYEPSKRKFSLSVSLHLTS